MKLLIASDLHGSWLYVRELLSAVEAEAPERILLLGDLLYHGPRNDLPEGYAPKQVMEALNALKDRIIAVRGNCEAEVDQMVLDFPCLADSATVFADGVQLYLTHGHHAHPDRLPPRPRGSELRYGHTHVGYHVGQNGILWLNPGSVSIPKDGQHSYMIYENGVFTRKNLAGEVLFVRRLEETT